MRLRDTGPERNIISDKVADGSPAEQLGRWGQSQRREQLLEVGDDAHGHQVGENVPDCEAHLEDVVPRLHVSYVNPLAVNVCVVGVVAAWTQALGKGERSVESQSQPMPIQGRQAGASASVLPSWPGPTVVWALAESLFG